MELPHIVLHSPSVISDLVPSKLCSEFCSKISPCLSQGALYSVFSPCRFRGHSGGGSFSESLLGHECGCPPGDHHGHPVLQWQNPRVSLVVLCANGSSSPKANATSANPEVSCYGGKVFGQSPVCWGSSIAGCWGGFDLRT